MATNQVFRDGARLSVACTDPSTPASNDPVLLGQLPGVALVDEDGDGNTTVTTRGVYTLSVKGVDGNGDIAVAAGDILYYVSADTPKLSKKGTGVRFGYALDAVGSGVTSTVRVKVGY